MRAGAIFIVLFIIGAINGYAQNRFIATIDTHYIDNIYLNDSTDLIAFCNDVRLNEEFDPLNPDVELLNAGLYAMIQKERLRRSRGKLNFSKEQYTVCSKFLDFYYPDKFINNDENISSLDKAARKALKKIRFPLGYSKVITFKARALDFKGNSFYYLKTAHETELKLFKGTRPAESDSAKLAELSKVPLKLFTYKKFLDRFIKDYIKKKYNVLLNSKEFSSMACFFKIDPRTLNKEKIPEVAFIMIYGADRLKYMQEAIAKSKNQKKLI